MASGVESDKAVSTEETSETNEWDSMMLSYTDILVPSFKPLYDSIAKIVETHFIERTPAHDAAAFMLIDYGCGPGEPLFTVADNLINTGSSKKWDLLGIDSSQEMIKRATSTNRYSQVKFSKGELGLLCYNQEIDVIICSLVLMYVSDAVVDQILQKFYQSLKQDGKVVIAVWNQKEYVYFLNLVKATIAQFSPVPPTKEQADASFRFGNKELIIELLNRHGFRNIQCSEINVDTSSSSVLQWIGEVPFIKERKDSVSEWMTNFTNSLPPAQLKNSAFLFVAQK